MQTPGRGYQLRGYKLEGEDRAVHRHWFGVCLQIVAQAPHWQDFGSDVENLGQAPYRKVLILAGDA